MTSQRIIGEFRGEHRWLSNFFPAQVKWGGMHLPTAEHAYQAAKCVNRNDALLISCSNTPAEAKRIGRTSELRPDWEDVKINVMRVVLARKFQDFSLWRKLRDTGDALLMEGNTWGDTFWGIDLKTRAGYNHLGVLLMQLRAATRFAFEA